MNDRNPEDPLPALLAEIDQAIAMAPYLARLARGYYIAFLEQDFTETQALTLTINQLNKQA